MLKSKLFSTGLAALIVITAAFYFAGAIKADAASKPAAKLSAHIKKAVKKNALTQAPKKAAGKTAEIKPLVKAEKIHPPRIQSPLIAENPKISTPAVTAPIVSTVSDNPSCALGDFDAQFLCLLNRYRQSLGKNPLAYDSALINVAQAYSDSMNTTKVFAHTAPDGSNFTIRCERQNTTCYGEILAYYFTSAQNLFDLWKNSPPHNAIMTGDYQSFGLATAGPYATGLFR